MLKQLKKQLKQPMRVASKLKEKDGRGAAADAGRGIIGTDNTPPSAGRRAKKVIQFEEDEKITAIFDSGE